MTILKSLSDSGLLSLLLWFLVPTILERLFSFFKKSKKQNKPRPSRPVTAIDRFASFLFFSITLIAFYYAKQGQPVNYLKIWQSSVDEPSFVLRNKFREFMVEKYPKWTEGISSWAFPSPLKEEIMAYEKIYDKLRDKEERKIYVNSGHDSFFYCQWCTDPLDYVLYNIPMILLQYVLMAIVVGVGTWSRRKYFLRMYAQIAFPIMFFFELCLMSLADELRSEKGVFDNNLDFDLFTFPFWTCFKFRWYAFAIFSLACFMRNDSDQMTDREMLQEMVKQHHSLVARGTAYRLAFHTMLVEEPLRNKVVETFRKLENQRKQVLRTEEFQTLKDTVVNKDEVKKTLISADQLTRAILEDAIELGYLEDKSSNISWKLPMDIEVLKED